MARLVLTPIVLLMVFASACNLKPHASRTGTFEGASEGEATTTITSTTSPAASSLSSSASTPAGVSTTVTPKPPVVAALPVGPGPKADYLVQQQPAPGTCHYTIVDATAGEVLPDPHCTPGAISPAVTQQNLGSTICKKGYTASVRPPVGITDAEKAANSLSYGYTGSLKTGEYDHLVPLELGGDPNDPRNLWLEPNKSSAASVNNPKDSVESSLNYLVCNALHGKPYLPLAKAQELIASNWTTAKAAAQQFLVNP